MSNKYSLLLNSFKPFKSVFVCDIDSNDIVFNGRSSSAQSFEPVIFSYVFFYRNAIIKGKKLVMVDENYALSASMVSNCDCSIKKIEEFQ